MKQTYDVKGFWEKVDSEADFDGVFETITYYQLNNPILSETDSDHNTFHVRKFISKDGIMLSSEMIYPSTGLSRKTCYFSHFLLNYCEVDSDLGGKMDTRVEYDLLGEEKKREKF